MWANQIIRANELNSTLSHTDALPDETRKVQGPRFTRASLLASLWHEPGHYKSHVSNVSLPLLWDPSEGTPVTNQTCMVVQAGAGGAMRLVLG